MEKGKIDEKNFGSAPTVANDVTNQTLTIDVGQKQSSGETQYIYLTFKIKNGEDNKVVLGTKKNEVEIGSFKTYYAQNTVLPHYRGQNDYKITNNTTISGRVDKDSKPSSIRLNKKPAGEDDEDQGLPSLQQVYEPLSVRFKHTGASGPESERL